MVRRATLVLLLALVGWGPAALAAADAADAIGAAKARVATAEAELSAAEASRADLARLADAVSGYGDAVAALERGVALADQRTLALSDGFTARRTEIMRLIAALEAISRAPVPQRGIHPDGPLGAARAAAMVDRLQPALRTEAARLGEELTALRAARAVEAEGAEALAGTRARLAEARSTLATALAAAAPSHEGPEVSTLTMMARDSESLSELAAALARSDDAPPPPAKASEGPLLWPVEGEVVRGFEERDAAGVRRPGLVVGTPPLALVKAPADAVVRYAGPFLEYGYVAVLEPDAETMLVLAGLSQIHVRTGASIRRGELLGLMGGQSPDVEESVTPGGDTGTGPGETLYIEIRQGRGPVDPAPLFRGDNG
jgi:septal ring factor EnvC (AmiA/AmiB activator)